MKIKQHSKSALALLLAICLMLQMITGIVVFAAEEPALTVSGLRCDLTENPLGIDNQTPALSWKLASNERGVLQQTYRIQVAESEEKLASGDYVWDSGVQTSEDSANVPYSGPAMTSGTRYFWQVTVTDNKGNTATSTETAYWEMGLLSESDWEANWIEINPDNKPNPSSYTVEMDFRIVKDDVGIIFAGKDGNNFLMWQINTFEKKFNGVTSFRPHQWVNGAASVLTEKTIEDVIPKDKQHDQHHIKIAVDGNKITTWIDNQLINEMTNEHAAYGKLGFRQTTAAGDCDEQGTFDNIVVKAGEEILFEDDFSSGKNSFNIGEVRDGELYVVNALGFQKETDNSAPMYRKSFEVDQPVKKATIHSSALGIYDLELNGKPVSDDFFNPGWTNYELNQDDNNYVMYQTFDVTEMVQQGENVLGAITGHGWYSGKLFIGGNNRYGTGSKLLCQLEIEYADGSKKVVATDSSWKITGQGPILEDDFQGGETYDATREFDGWSAPDFVENSSWTAAKVGSYSGAVVAQMGPTVKAIQEFKPTIVSSDNGTYILDLGQNIAGFARLNGLKGEAGSTMKLRFGEMLNKDGSLYTANLRSAKATDYYTFKGDPEGESWQPRFTFHGFRYIEITGYNGTLTEDNITGIALSSLQEQTGSFETSNDLINQLQSNITWGQKDNFISVPTDCPQRDERLGYTGDGQVFIRTAAMNMNVGPFFKKFMADVTTNQRADGAVADWSPNYVTPGDSWSASFHQSGWGDAVVIMPWTMYTAYGDESFIHDNYEAMKKYIQYYKNKAGETYVISVGTNGDWLNVNDSTPQNVISTAYFAYVSELLSKMAAVIGNTEDAAYYHQLFLDVREDFNDAFVSADGAVTSNTQTSYLLALKFDLLPTQELREKAAAKLVENIKAHDWHLTTGFLGVSLLCPVLSDMGYSDVAYRLLQQESYPGWLYSVVNGATTIWERWDSYIAETGQFGDVGMNSFNHYSYGSVGEWFYNYVGGIKTDEKDPGYKHFTIAPTPGGDLNYANTTFESRYGTIVSNWKLENGTGFALDVVVPANSTATLSIPSDMVSAVMESGKNVLEDAVDGITFVECKDGRAVFELGSGSYHFASTVVDKSGLDAAIAKGNSYYEFYYTEDSYKGLQDAVAAAQALVLDKNAAQTAVDGAIAAIDTAIESLSRIAQGGTEQDPYLIGSVADLQKLARSVNAGASFKDEFVKLTADLDLSGIDWTPIGTTGAITAGVGFAGTFDGASHVVSNLGIADTTSSATFGLFGMVSGTVKNLGVKDVQIKVGSGDCRAGGLVGTVNGGLIDNCYVVNANVDAGSRVAGGLAGQNFNGTIKNSYVKNITVKGGRSAIFVSDNQDDNRNNKGTIDNCYADGSITSGNNGIVTNSKTITAAAYTNGELVALLNGSAQTPVWEQGESYPVLIAPAEPVDRTDLENAIAEAAEYEGKEADYTADSWKAFSDALAEANRVLGDPDADQAAVSNAAQGLRDAIAGLTPVGPTVNKDKLNEVLESAKALNQDDYTPNSWAGMDELIAAAQDVYDNSEDQEEVDGMTNQLVDKMLSIRLKANKEELAKAIEAAGKIDQSLYTEESVAALKEALAEATRIYEDQNISVDDQKLVDDAAAALNNAIAGLEKIPQPPVDANKVILERVISYAEQAQKSDEYAGAIASVKASFDAALLNAQTVFADEAATQAEIDSAWISLMNEIHKLGFQAGDKKQLEVVFTQASEIDLSNYVAAGQEEFKAALANAEIVLADGDALQSDVDEAVDSLLQAMLNLRFKADKSVLQAVLANADKLDLSAFTAETVALFNEAKAAADLINSDENAVQQAVDKAAADLQAAINGLKAVDNDIPATQVEGDQAMTNGSGSAKTGDTAPIAAAALLAVLACAGFALSKKKR